MKTNITYKKLCKKPVTVIFGRQESAVNLSSTHKSKVGLRLPYAPRPQLEKEINVYECSQDEKTEKSQTFEQHGICGTMEEEKFSWCYW